MRNVLIALIMLSSLSGFAQAKDTLAKTSSVVNMTTINNITNAAVAKAVVYTSIHQMVSQSGTAAPVVSRKDTNYTGVTLTWARTAVGTYTCTASQPIFSTTNTACIIGGLSSNAYKVSYTVNSSTQITFNTGVTTIVSALANLLVSSNLVFTNTDGIFGNTLIIIFNY